MLLNYYATGKSTELIINYLKEESIIEDTIPGVITPHVYHLYNHCINLKPKSECSNFSNKQYQFPHQNTESFIIKTMLYTQVILKFLE